ncbi:DNA polymerase I [Arsenicicoccus dermatophilus]|uniref:DNA polymerase I n=1 Tax=Arsenicicoccus dermatophilus TaxID=1076331 RepID=UPI001F4C86FB|nr:DNA polymerase I [Arsenicicoccus dermatophilus]
MTRLLLLDGHSLAYRAFFALPAENFSTSTGQTTNAVYGFTSMLINLLRDEQPTHVAVAFDLSRQTFRMAEYAEYKAGRSATPDEFKGQVSLVQEVLDALRIRHLSVEGFEADDIIATLTTQAREAGIDEVVICSGDRDAFQLVDDRTTLLYPVRGVSEVWRMDPAAVETKYLVPPSRYSDLAALVGETSDNLPGVPGVGPKTAAKWITAYGDLAGIVEHVHEIKGKAGESLRTHLDQVLRNRRLNQLVRDVELPITIDDLARANWERDEVHRVFDGLEFRVLRDRLFATVESAAPEAESGFAIDGATLAPGELGGWLAEHAATGRCGLVVVGRWARGTRDVDGLALAAPDGSGAYAAAQDLTPDDETALGRWLADPAATLVLHEAKGQLQALWARGFPEVAGVDVDTALAAYLVRPDQRSYDLADLALRHLHRELTVDGTGSAQGMLDFSADQDAEAQTAMVRARAVVDLAEVLEAELERTGQRALLTDVELPLLRVLAEMERDGIGVDQEGLATLESEFGDQVRAAQQDAHDAIGDDTVNLGSPKQLQTVLFETLGMPRTKRTKTGYTTDAEALKDLYEREPHPFLEALLRHRDAAKLRSTIEGLRKSVAEDGRIHTTYLQTVAATGRLSSTEPNLQNVPIRTEEGRRIRSVFVVGRGREGGEHVEFESLMSADYSQIEMRIMAHLSGDAGLVEAFRSGEDLHRFVGSRVFQVDPGDVTPAMRAKVKAMSYGLAYGLSAFGLSKQLRISTGEAQGLMDGYFERFGGVRDYLREIVAEARTTGYTATILGRRRYLPDLTSDNRNRREMAERMALNAPIQGSAADIVKLAMLGIDRALRAEGLRSRMLLQVHDELLLEVAPGERETVEALVRREMGAAVEMDVPLDVHVGVGRSWQDAEH